MTPAICARRGSVDLRLRRVLSRLEDDVGDRDLALGRIRDPEGAGLGHGRMPVERLLTVRSRASIQRALARGRPLYAIGTFRNEIDRQPTSLATRTTANR